MLDYFYEYTEWCYINKMCYNYIIDINMKSDIIELSQLLFINKVHIFVFTIIIIETNTHLTFKLCC